jgi:hypothetical protein
MAALRNSSVSFLRFCFASLTTPLLLPQLNPYIRIFFLFLVLPFSPEPHILLFRRPLGTDPQSGRVDPELVRKAREEYQHQYRK